MLWMMKGRKQAERSEKQIDREMEAEWRRYKEQSEQRIRRERQKLQKYEKKLQEIHGDEQSKRNTKNPSNSPERMSSPPRAYGGRAAYSSSESDREPSPASKSEGEADRCQTKFDPYQKIQPTNTYFIFLISTDTDEFCYQCFMLLKPKIYVTAMIYVFSHWKMIGIDFGHLIFLKR